MTPKLTLMYPQKQDAGRAQLRPPDAPMRGPVPNGPWSQARASNGPCPASSTSLPLEEDPCPSRSGRRKVTKTSQISGSTQDQYLKTETKKTFTFPGWNSRGTLSLVEVGSCSDLRSDCGSSQKCPGSSRKPGFGNTRVSVGRVRPRQRDVIGTLSPHASLELSLRVWPSGLVGTRPEAGVTRFPRREVFRGCSRPDSGSFPEPCHS